MKDRVITPGGEKYPLRLFSKWTSVLPKKLHREKSFPNTINIVASSLPYEIPSVFTLFTHSHPFGFWVFSHHSPQSWALFLAPKGRQYSDQKQKFLIIGTKNVKCYGFPKITALSSTKQWGHYRWVRKNISQIHPLPPSKCIGNSI